MRKTSLVTLFFFYTVIVFSQNKELPYKIGEYCSYSLSYGFINAAYAEYHILERVQKNNISTYHIQAKGRTASFFDWFFKVRDLYETYLDTASLSPIFFNRDVNEGGYIIKQQYYFNPKQNVVKTKDSIYNVPNNVQDMVSAFFFARTQSKQKVLKDSGFVVPIFLDEQIYKLEVKYLYNENIKTKWGEVNCMVFMPKMQKGRIFEHEEKMKIWITDDRNHILFKVEAEIWAGTIKAELNNFSGLKYPFGKNIRNEK